MRNTNLTQQKTGYNSKHTRTRTTLNQGHASIHQTQTTRMNPTYYGT